jgi:hypothetical protein
VLNRRVNAIADRLSPQRANAESHDAMLIPHDEIAENITLASLAERFGC